MSLFSRQLQGRALRERRPPSSILFITIHERPKNTVGDDSHEVFPLAGAGGELAVALEREEVDGPIGGPKAAADDPRLPPDRVGALPVGSCRRGRKVFG